MQRPAALRLLPVVLLAACTASPGPSASPVLVTPTGTASSASSTGPSAAPTLAPTAAPPVAHGPFSIFPADQPGEVRGPVTCNGTIGPDDPVAIVTRASPTEEEWTFSLVSLADGTPREVCRLPEGGSPLELLDGTHLVLVGGTDDATFEDTLAVVEVPSARYEWFRVPESGNDVNTSFVALSRERDAMTWLRTDYGNHVEEIHLATATGDAVLESFEIDDGGRCGSIEDSRIGAFSASGAHSFVLRQPIAQLASLTVFDGSKSVLSIAPPDDGRWADGRHPAMALWAPDSETLYYRKGQNVYRWEPGSEPTVFLNGVRWYDPTFSGDGRWLAFSTYREDGASDVHLIDLMAGSSEPIRVAKGAGAPIFLSATLLWYQSEDAGCVGPEVQPRLYDTVTGMTSETDITGVFSAWPGTSSR
jgi:hypothetical protein